MKRKILLSIFCVLCSTFCANILTMKPRKFVNSVGKIFSAKIRLKDALINGDCSKATSLLRKNSKIKITKKFLVDVILKTEKRVPRYMDKVGSVCIWKGANIFCGYDTKLFAELVKHMDSDTVLDPWIIGSVIHSERSEFLEAFLKQYKKQKGDINKLYGQKKKWGWCDFIVAAGKNNQRFFKLAMPKMMDLFFKNGLLVGKRYKRPSGNYKNGKLNAFEEYFYNGTYSKLFAKKLLSESFAEGAKAHLMISIRDRDMKSVKEWIKKIKPRILAENIDIYSFASPLGFAIVQGNDEILEHLLQKYTYACSDGLDNYLFSALNHGYVASAQLLLERGASVEPNMLAVATQNSEHYNCSFMKKLVDRCKQSNKTITANGCKNIIKFCFGKAGNQELIKSLEQTGVLQNALFDLMQEEIYFSELIKESGDSRLYKNCFFKNVVDLFKNPDFTLNGKLPIAAKAMQALNYDVFELMLEKNANISYALDCLRKKSKEKNKKDAVVATGLLSKQELESFYKSSYRSQADSMDKVKLNLILKKVNKNIKKRNVRGFSFFSQNKKKYDFAFPLSIKKGFNFYDALVVTQEN
ncbi:hypothetical protein KAH94_02095 [bacterium]|nr:hypothetical protein [bacterium]